MYSDGTRSQTPDQDLKGNKWVDVYVPKECQTNVARIQLMSWREDSCLVGLKLMDKDSDVLLAVG